MSDLIDASDTPEPGDNAPEFTVSEISGAVKKTLEGAFGRIRVRGEVGRVFRARSGHLYYDIKDDRNVLACTTWKGQVSGLTVVPEEGMEVIVSGRLTAFGAQSKYNLNADQVAPAGVGALMAMLEKRKKQLEAEGLFAPDRKRPLPFLPEVIGVVTSPSGAVIRDILHRLRDRFPRKVLIWPVAVQGRDCAPQVAAAIDGFNRLSPGGALPRPDVLIVARGGGSIEDLWGFNEEIVARAAAGSAIPLISAVGHETDTTLIDYVADRRAPTPTAAAEIAVPVRLDLLAHVEGQGARLVGALARGMTRRGERLRDLARALPRRDALLGPSRQRFDHIATRLPNALTLGLQQRQVALARHASALRPPLLLTRLRAGREALTSRDGRLVRALGHPVARARVRLDNAAGRLRPQPLWSELERRRQRLTALDRMLNSLNYEETLKRGFAVVWGDGAVVTTREAAAQATALELQFQDGRLALAGTAPRPASPVEVEEPKKTGRHRTGKTGDVPPDQGSLF